MASVPRMTRNQNVRRHGEESAVSLVIGFVTMVALLGLGRWPRVLVERTRLPDVLRLIPPWFLSVWSLEVFFLCLICSMQRDLGTVSRVNLPYLPVLPLHPFHFFFVSILELNFGFLVLLKRLRMQTPPECSLCRLSSGVSISL